MRRRRQVPESWSAELEAFHVWMRAAGRFEGTRKMRLYQLTRLACELETPPAEVSGDELLAWIGNPDWGHSYRRSMRATLRSFFGWMRATGRIDLDPAYTLPTVSSPPGLPRPAADDALAQAMMRAPERTRQMILLAASAGLRCCEIAPVHSRDVIGRRPDRRLRVTGKGGRIREVPLLDSLATTIVEAHGYLFPGQIDGHISAAYVSKLISRTLPGYTAHQLRHRYATKALRGSGGNLIVVQRLLGHASVATTQVYTHVDDDQLRDAAMWAA